MGRLGDCRLWLIKLERGACKPSIVRPSSVARRLSLRAGRSLAAVPLKLLTRYDAVVANSCQHCPLYGHPGVVFQTGLRHLVGKCFDVCWQ